MNNEILPQDGFDETKEDKLRRYRIRVGATGILAGGIIASGMGYDGAKEIGEYFAESNARAEAAQVCESLTFDDLLKVKLTDVSEGPNVIYNDRPSRSIELDIETTPGDMSNNRWVRDGGNRVGDFKAECQWYGPNLVPRYFDPKTDEELAHGAAVVLPPSGKINENIEPTLFDSLLDCHEPERKTIVIPINQRIQGKRHLQVIPELNDYQFTTNEPDSRVDGKDVQAEPIFNGMLENDGKTVRLDGVPLEDYTYKAQ